MRSTDFNGATFAGTDFSGSNMRKADFSNAKFVSVDFSRTNVEDAVWNGAKFQQILGDPISLRPILNSDNYPDYIE